MKIEKLEISDFRGKTFTLVPQKHNVFFAPNGMGKTTIQDGIRYALTGYLPKNVSGKPEAKARFESGFEFSRGKSCMIGTKKVPAKSLDEAIEAETGVSIDDMKITSSSELFLAKKPEEFLAVLTKYIPEDMDLATLKTYFSVLDPEKEAILDKEFPAAPDKFSIAKISEVVGELTVQKKMLNADLTQKKKILESMVNVAAPARSLADIDADLAAVSQAEANGTSYQTALSAYQAALQAKAEQEAKMKALEQKIDGYKALKPASTAQRQALDAQRDKADRVRAETERDLATAKSNLALFQKTLDSLDKPVCPISAKLVCTTDKKGIKAEMQTSIASNTRLKENLERNLESASAQIQRLNAQKAEFDRIDLLLKEKEGAENMLEMLKKTPVTVPQQPVQVSGGSNAGILKQKLNEERQQVVDYEKKQTLEKESEILRDQYKLVTDLISSLSDKGEVKAKVIEHYFGAFEQACNDRAHQFAPGYEVKFVAEGGVEPYLKVPSGSDFVPMGSLSSGEKLIGTFIIMDMLNQLNGTKLCFLDNVEILDETSLQRLRRLVEDPAFADTYDHIFIMGVDHGDVTNAFAGMHAVA